jgi:hypothetical protein
VFDEDPPSLHGFEALVTSTSSPFKFRDFSLGHLQEGK